MTPRTPYILLTFANPQSVPKAYLPALHRESAEVYQSLEQLALEDICDVNRLPEATLEQVFDMVEKWQQRKDLLLFHYGGHASGDSLLLATAQGENQAAHATGFAELLGRLPTLQLVFLNGCSTQAQVELLLEKGVKAVIATAQPVADEMAVDFAGRFYQNLGQGATLGAAFDQASIFLQAKYHQQTLSVESSGSLAFVAEAETGLPWGLYFKEGEEAVKDWRLPQTPLHRSPAEKAADNRLAQELLAQIEASQQKPRRSLWLGLAAGLLLALLLGGWYQVWGPGGNFDLQLHFYADPDFSRLVEAGEVQVYFDQAPDATYPLQSGQIQLKNLPPSLRGDSLRIQPDIEGFESATLPVAVPQQGSYLPVYLPPKRYQETVRGTLKDADGNALAGARVVFGQDTSLTDRFGDFAVTVPYPPGTRLRLRIFYQQKEVYNGEEKVSESPLNLSLGPLD